MLTILPSNRTSSEIKLGKYMFKGDTKKLTKLLESDNIDINPMFQG